MDLTVGDIFRRAARATPARPAAWLAGAPPVTFGDLDRDANRLAHALRHAGIVHADRVAWWGESILEVLPLFAALAKLGAVLVPINPHLSIAEARPLVDKVRPRLLIGDAAGAAKAAELGTAVATLAGGRTVGVDLSAAVAQASDADVHEPRLRETDAHVIFLTSGSTGGPKGVVLSHRANVLRAFAGSATRGGATACMFPLYHMAGWSIALGCWHLREEVAFVRQPDAASLLAAIAERRCRRLYAIPAVWGRILAEDLGRWDLSTLREADTGTSATPPELITQIRAALPQATTRIFYGSTEAGPATTLMSEDVLRKSGSVGPPAPGVEVRLSDAGEVCVRSSFLMDGYFEDAAATSAAVVDGWYHSGDVGALDDEGYLAIVGRLRDLIRTGGESVAPPEVEAVLSGCAGVAEVAVVGIPDARWGEIVCAVVVPQAGATVTLDGLRAACAGRLAAYKQPRRLEIVESLPRTGATGQIQRTLLVERLAAATAARS